MRSPTLPNRAKALEAFECEPKHTKMKNETMGYKEGKGVLDAHVLPPGAVWTCEFVSLKELRARIKKMHPTFSMDTRSIVEYLVSQHCYKPTTYNEVLGYWIATDGMLLEKVEAKKTKRRRVAREKKAGRQLPIAHAF